MATAEWLRTFVAIYRTVGGRRPGPVTRGFRRAQILSGGLLAFAHGANDAQKTMGVITLALIANHASEHVRQRSAQREDGNHLDIV